MYVAPEYVHKGSEETRGFQRLMRYQLGIAVFTRAFPLPCREACWGGGFKLLELFVCGRRMTSGGGGTSQGATTYQRVHAAVDLR